MRQLLELAREWLLTVQTRLELARELLLSPYNYGTSLRLIAHAVLRTVGRYLL